MKETKSKMSTIFKASTYNEAKLFVIEKLNLSLPIYLLDLLHRGANGKSYLLRDIESLLKDKGYCRKEEVTDQYNYCRKNDDWEMFTPFQGKVIATSNCIHSSMLKNSHCFIVDMSSLRPMETVQIHK